jgi:predicted nucleotidyltransferase
VIRRSEKPKAQSRKQKYPVSRWRSFSISAFNFQLSAFSSISFQLFFPHSFRVMDIVISQLLAANQRRINALCSELVVRELRIFGSAVSGKFNISTSDVDVLVDFFDSDAPGIADRFMALALGLERIFQRPVDLVTRQGMKNPIFRATVEQTSQPLYAA